MTFINVKDAAKITGLAVRTMYKLIEENVIPHYRPGFGKRVFFNPEELESWMRASRVRTIDELSIEANQRLEVSRKRRIV